MTTSRDLVKKALNFEKLHRIPREMYFDNEYLLKNFPSDVASPPFQYFSDKRSGVINSKGFWTDEWGCIWEAAEEGEQLAGGGGYIAGPSQVLASDVPFSNVITMFDEILKA